MPLMHCIQSATLAWPRESSKKGSLFKTTCVSSISPFAVKAVVAAAWIPGPSAPSCKQRKKIALSHFHTFYSTELMCCAWLAKTYVGSFAHTRASPTLVVLWLAQPFRLILVIQTGRQGMHDKDPVTPGL